MAICLTCAGEALAQDANQNVGFNWGGCYTGVNIGSTSFMPSGSANIPGASGSAGTSVPSSYNLPSKAKTTIAYGAQIGCNQKTENFIIGIEGDIGFDNSRVTRTLSAGDPLLVAQGASFVAGDSFKVSSNLHGSIRGRIGYAIDQSSLLYLTFGMSWSPIKVNSNYIAIGVFPADVTSDSHLAFGPTAGIGWERAIDNDLTLGLEGKFTAYGSYPYNAGQLTTVTLGSGIFTYAPASTTVSANEAEVMVRLNWYPRWSPFGN